MKHRRRPRILLLPWLGYGHLSPFLDLARQLSCRGFTAFLCSTQGNLSSIKERLQEKSYSNNIRTIEIQLPSLPGLPSHCQATSSLPSSLMPLLKKAFDLSKPNFLNILQTVKPDCVIYDFLQPWAPKAAEELNIPAILFISTSAACFSYCLSLTRRNEHKKHDDGGGGGGDSPFEIMNFLEHEQLNFHRMTCSESNGIRDSERVNQCVNESKDLILIRSIREIESKFIDYLSSFCTGKRVIPVGSLLSPPSPQRAKSPDDQDEFTDWLAEKKRSSVVFVSFGTEYFMSREEIKEIALGLELSEQNFIWVVRALEEEEEEESVESTLFPLGFLKRTQDRGMVVRHWAPQMKLLSHPSTGGFLTHCGWGSIHEGIACGVPFIALPLHLDQPVNAKVVVDDLGLGVQIERERDGSFRKEKVAEGIRRVMVYGDGEKIREKAKELLNKTGDQGDIDALVEELKRMGRIRKVPGVMREMKASC